MRFAAKGWTIAAIARKLGYRTSTVGAIILEAQKASAPA
jgi:DNA-binding NarL/FixJ family response regulator